MLGHFVYLHVADNFQEKKRECTNFNFFDVEELDYICMVSVLLE